MSPPLPPDADVRNEFVRRGCPIPPPQPYKVAVLKAYQKWAGLRVFVETGTFMAETTQLMSQVCERVHSIELRRGFSGRRRRCLLSGRR